MMDVLSLLDILNKGFQKSDSSLPTSLSILKSVRENLNSLLHNYTIKHITGLIIQKVLSLKKMNLAHPGKERGQFQIGLKTFYRLRNFQLIAMRRMT